MTYDCIIIGAGISGLTCAYELKKQGKNVLLLEASDNPGGSIRTVSTDGYELEWGPNSFRIENEESERLINELGLSSKLVEASPNAKKRFILLDGKLVATPSGPQDIFTTKLFSLSGKLRALREPFIAKSNKPDESIDEFFSRRLGREILENAADPFVTGIYAGDTRKLSIAAAFPKLWQTEQEHGSLFRGAMKSSKAKKAGAPKFRRRIISFAGGLSALPNALAAALGDRLMLGVSVTSIRKDGSEWIVTASNEEYRAKHIIIASPAHRVAALVPGINADVFESIEYPPVMVAYLGYRNADAPNLPAGFGALIPSKEKRDILGIIYSSSLFGGKAPQGQSLITVLMGGARHADLFGRTDAELISIASREASALLGLPTPAFTALHRVARAIPQYNLGHGEKIAAIERIERESHGLHFLANYRGGISIGACIRSATELAQRLV